MEFTKEELQLIGRLLYEKFAESKEFLGQDKKDFDSGLVLDLYEKVKNEYKDQLFDDEYLFPWEK